MGSEKNLDKKAKIKGNNFAKSSKPQIKASPARISAYEILLKIEKEKAFSSVLLPIYEDNLEAKDRALCHELTLGVLRRQLYLDKVIEYFSTKKLDLEIKVILRLGLYQLLFLNKIPEYSAINESVNLAVSAKKTSAKGFVNAILRRFLREKPVLEFTSEIEKISIETSHPIWLIEKWIKQFGIEETRKLAEANNETPNIDYRQTVLTSEKTLASLDELSRRELFDLAENGEIYFQDKASQLVGKTVDLQSDESFLDVCAAPASKFTQLAVLRAKSSDSAKSQVFIGGDLHLQRVKLMLKNSRKQGLRDLSFLQYDAEDSLPFAEETFDVILLDAPCSGTGTIRHNPEIRYSLTEKDFDELSQKQLKILNNASKLLKRGGRLIYSTCSLETEENEKVIEHFLANNSDFSKMDVTDFPTENGFSRTFPQSDKMDGFFIAKLKKS